MINITKRTRIALTALACVGFSIIAALAANYEYCTTYTDPPNAPWPHCKDQPACFSGSGTCTWTGQNTIVDCTKEDGTATTLELGLCQ